jgi:ABC-type transport system involved in multi-copper enzyme maturation permease subunit
MTDDEANSMTDVNEPTTEPLQPADATPADTAPAAQTPMPRRRRRSPFTAFTRTAGGVGAVGAKELRGRMRGRRAFVILSLYLVLLAGFAWMVELIMERTYQGNTGGNAAFATAAIGQGIFAALLMLETLLVAFLAPMATAGSISLEREKQTLEMLAATPITSVAIVLGKLLSALVYVWLLIAASIPLTAVVFVFGGVAPEDLVRGYLILIVTALGLGSFGLFCSSLVKRTQAATAITIFGVLSISMGSLFVVIFWQALATGDNGIGTGPIKGAPPAPLVFLNPFMAQAEIAPTDALCGTDNALRYYCRFRSAFLTDQNGVFFIDNTNGGFGKPQILPGFIVPARPIDVNGGGVAVAPDLGVAPPADVVPFGAQTTSIWQMTVIAWLILSAVFLALSVQFVSPTRRWRLRRGRPVTRSVA